MLADLLHLQLQLRSLLGGLGQSGHMSTGALHALLLLREEGFRSPGQLAESLAIRNASLTPILRSLEKEGLILRAKARQDGRRQQLAITRAGRERLSRIEQRLGQSITGNDFDDSPLGKVAQELLKSGN